MSRAATRNLPSNFPRARLPHDAERAKPWRVLCDYLAPWVDPGAGLLDLGAGYGDFSRYSKASPKWALDHNPDLAGYWPDNVQPLVQPAPEPLPFWNGSLGTVFAANLFERFPVEQGARILEEVRRVLRPGGRLIVVQSNFRLEPRRYFENYNRQTVFTDTSFRRYLAGAGFRVLHSEPRFAPLSMASRWARTAWMFDLYLQLPFRPFAGQFLAIAEPEPSAVRSKGVL